jgi:CheY-like chemotaxis protein/CBS domain-containing protein
MTSTDLISINVAVGLVYERLSEVARRIAASRSHYCVVLGDDGRTFMGLVRLADVAGRSNPGNRILGDLVGQITPLVVRSTEPAEGVAALFVQHSLGEAIVLDAEDHYVGLITSESVLAWSVRELQLRGNALDLTAPPPELPLPAVARQVRNIPTESSEKKILLVEDHPPSRGALKLILRRRNFEVLESGSVAEALGLAARHKFDLVISDVGLPDGSGFGLMKELRRLYTLKGIAITARGAEEDRAISLEAGFSCYLKKPVHVHELEQAIVDVLSASSGVV